MRTGGGHYVALEGLEGAGKSTIAQRLVAWLEQGGREVVHVREPGGTALGERIREMLLDRDRPLSPWSEAMLFAAARAELAVRLVAPALAEGRWVVSDRSVYSSLAYQGGGRRLGVPLVRSINQAGLDDVWPELVVLLRLDPQDGLARQQVADPFGAEGPAFWQRVAETFDELAAAEPDRLVVVEAARPLEEVVTDVLKVVSWRWR
ncbi:MAG: dTMP kinase [Actinomycetota bacterium]|nr:dTMP kinase [Actinomycetota bacterium]